ncbi:beta-propeller fold lactonase family protein [Streptomyces sp. NPDC093071]|uniref:beta-propeller fold lactonase family protein n=1 Tax=Streptomyces sp. NPDC093071 TaxID=3366022 RepID=UPI003813F927
MSLFKNAAAGNRGRGTAPRRSTRNAFTASAVAALAATALLTPSTAVGAPSAGLFSSGTQSSSLSAGAPGRFMLVGSTGSGHIAVYGVSRDGALTKVAGSPFAADTGFSVVVSPDGKRAYVTSLSKKWVKGFAIGTNGALSAIPGAVAQYDAAVLGVAFSPDGTRLYATVGGQTSGTMNSIAVAQDGTLAKIGRPATIPGTSYMSLPVVSTDGRTVYASNFNSSNVTPYRTAADGSLTQLSEPVPTGNGPALPNVTPDGRFLYTTNEQGNNISGFAIAADGTLTPTPGSPYKSGNLPHGGAVTPDSKRMYLPEAGSNKISGYSIADDGSLTPLAGSPYPGPANTMPGRVVLSPDARRLFDVDVLALSLTTKVHSFAIDPVDGSLARTSHPATDTGIFFADGPTSVITPNQGPVAKINTLYSGGRTGVFTASGSTDPDGSVVRYEWNFGDGTTATTTGPEVTHTFAQTGSRTVTVTVVDDEGCSDDRIFNGQVVSCNGGTKAAASTVVNLD